MTLWKTFTKSSLSVVLPKGKQCLSSKTLLGGVSTHTIMLRQVFIIPLYCGCLVFLFCLFLFCADISDFSPVGFTFNFPLNFPGHFGFHNCTKANRLEPPALLIQCNIYHLSKSPALASQWVILFTHISHMSESFKNVIW